MPNLLFLRPRLLLLCAREIRFDYNKKICPCNRIIGRMQSVYNFRSWRSEILLILFRMSILSQIETGFFQNISDLKLSVSIQYKGRRLDIPKEYPPEVRSMMQACWNEDPTTRPSFFLISNILTRLNYGSTDD